MGNHDYAVLYEPNKFNIGAEAACYWTRQQLEDEPDAAARGGHWDFLGSMVVKHVLSGQEFGMGEMAFVHGSPRRPVNEYIFPDDVYNNPGKIGNAFDRLNGVCFVGHTHVPGVFIDTPDFYSPDELRERLRGDAGAKGAHQRRLGGPAARPRPAGQLRADRQSKGHVRPSALRCRGNRAKGAGDTGTGRLPGPAAAGRAIVGSLSSTNYTNFTKNRRSIYPQITQIFAD